MKKRQLATVISLAAGVSAGAAMAADPGAWYGGASIGLASMDDQVLEQSVNDDDIGWKFFGGYQMSENLGIEGSWVDLGELTSLDASSATSGLAITANGAVPLTDDFDVIGKAGGFFWSADEKVSTTTNGLNNSKSLTEDGVDLLLGLGVRYMLPADIMQNLSIRGEWEFYQADQEINLLSAGVELQFK